LSRDGDWGAMNSGEYTLFSLSNSASMRPKICVVGVLAAAIRGVEGPARPPLVDRSPVSGDGKGKWLRVGCAVTKVPSGVKTAL
jgi:hypothetical protein